MGDFFGYDEGDVALAALDFREIGAVNLGEVGQLFLGEFFALPQGFNSCSKSLIDVHNEMIFSRLQSYCLVDDGTTGNCLQNGIVRANGP